MLRVVGPPRGGLPEGEKNGNVCEGKILYEYLQNDRYLSKFWGSRSLNVLQGELLGKSSQPNIPLVQWCSGNIQKEHCTHFKHLCLFLSYLIGKKTKKTRHREVFPLQVQFPNV